MGATDIILRLIEKNNGIVTTSIVSAVGISRGNSNHFVDMGKLEKTSRRVYILPETREDEFINLQSRFKRGVLFRKTALFLYDLTGRTPNHCDMMSPSHYNLTSTKKEDVRCIQVTGPLFGIKIGLAYTPNGNTVYVYNPERALCDILRPRSHVDIQIVARAFRPYTKQKNKNIPHLSEYARLFRVEEKLRHYLEVLL